MEETPRGFASEDEEATYCLSLLRDGDRTQKIVARERLSQIFEHRGLLDEAAQCLETNVREGIRDPRIYQRLAGVYRRQGRHELADEVLLEAQRLAERAARPPAPPGARPIRGGRPPAPRRPEAGPGPGPLEAPTTQLPRAAAAAAAVPPAIAPVPGGPLPAGPAASTVTSELSLDLPAPPSDAPAGPIDRPWWASPAAIVLAILLCGPFGLAIMWVRGDYSKRARVTATVVWAGLTVLMLAAAALTLQATVSSMIGDAGRLGALPGGPGAAATPLVFPTPAIPAGGQPPAAVAAKPAVAPSPPPIGASPGALGARPSPVVIAPAQPTPIPPPGTNPAPAGEGERVQVKDTGGSGANMRDKPGAIGNVIKTAPDGAALRIVGPDQDADGRTWRHVRDESGTEGWVATELVEPAT